LIGILKLLNQKYRAKLIQRVAIAKSQIAKKNIVNVIKLVFNVDKCVNVLNAKIVQSLLKRRNSIKLKLISLLILK
jgi:hypothetical protein